MSNFKFGHEYLTFNHLYKMISQKLRHKIIDEEQRESIEKEIYKRVCRRILSKK